MNPDLDPGPLALQPCAPGHALALCFIRCDVAVHAKRSAYTHHAQTVLDREGP